jgi:hypothetical protein
MNHNAGPAMAAALFKEGNRIGAQLDDELRARASQYMGIQLLLEDLPDPSNCMTVNASFRDSLGQPGIRVHYRLKDYAKSALPRTIDDYSNWLQAMNAVPQELSGAHWYNQHHIMGTVISRRLRSSNCRWAPWHSPPAPTRHSSNQAAIWLRQAIVPAVTGRRSKGASRCRRRSAPSTPATSRPTEPPGSDRGRWRSSPMRCARAEPPMAICIPRCPTRPTPG